MAGSLRQNRLYLLQILFKHIQYNYIIRRMSQKVSVKLLQGSNETTILLEDFEVKKTGTVKEFLEEIKNILGVSYDLIVMNKEQTLKDPDKVSIAIDKNTIFLRHKKPKISIVSVGQNNQEMTILRKFPFDLTLTVQKLIDELNTKNIKVAGILEKDKESLVQNKQYLAKSYMVNYVIYVKSSESKVKIFNFQSNLEIRSIDLSLNTTVKNFITKMKDSYNEIYTVYHENGAKASQSTPLSAVASANKIFVKPSQTKILAYSQNAKLERFYIKGDLDEALNTTIERNQKLLKYDIVNKENIVLDGLITLSEAVELVDKKYYLRYQQKPKQQLTEEEREERVKKFAAAKKRLQSINKDMKQRAEKSLAQGNKKMEESHKQLQNLMDELKKDVSYIQSQNENLSQKIQPTDKPENESFIQRLYDTGTDTGKVKKYTVPLMLEQCPSRIYWPSLKGVPLNFQRKLIDFQKCKIHRTNVNEYSELEIHTRTEEEAKSVSKSITENVNSLSTSAKVGLSTKFVSISLEANYSTENSSQKEDTNKELRTFQKEYVIFNALKKTEAYYIDEEDIVLKQNVKKKIKAIYDILQEDKNLQPQKRRLRFEKASESFFRKYGTQIDVATYTFGCRYSFNSQVESLQSKEEKQLATVARAVTNMGIAGSVEGGNLFFSASAGISVQKMDGSTESNLNKTSTDSHSYSFKISYNLQGLQVKNRDKWRQLSGVYKKGWKCLGFEDRRSVRLLDIMKNEGNQQNEPTYSISYNEFLSQMQEYLNKMFQEKEETDVPQETKNGYFKNSIYLMDFPKISISQTDQFSNQIAQFLKQNNRFQALKKKNFTAELKQFIKEDVKFTSGINYYKTKIFQDFTLQKSVSPTGDFASQNFKKYQFTLQINLKLEGNPPPAQNRFSGPILTMRMI